MKLTKSKLRKIIREELLNEATMLDRAYDDWHDATYTLNKLVKKTKDHNLMKIIAKCWDTMDVALLKWIEDND